MSERSKRDRKPTVAALESIASQTKTTPSHTAKKESSQPAVSSNTGSNQGKKSKAEAEVAEPVAEPKNEKPQAAKRVKKSNITTSESKASPPSAVVPPVDLDGLRSSKRERKPTMAYLESIAYLSKEAPTIQISEEEYEVDRIVKSRKRKGQTEYLIRWKGYAETANTWEPEECVSQEALDVFQKQQQEAGESSEKPSEEATKQMGQSKKRKGRPPSKKKQKGDEVEEPVDTKENGDDEETEDEEQVVEEKQNPSADTKDANSSRRSPRVRKAVGKQEVESEGGGAKEVEAKQEDEEGAAPPKKKQRKDKEEDEKGKEEKNKAEEGKEEGEAKQEDKEGKQAKEVEAKEEGDTAPPTKKQHKDKQQPTEEGEGILEVEEILKKRKVKKQLQYLVRWAGRDSSHDSWKPSKECPKDAIAKFESKSKEQAKQAKEEAEAK
eukprot:gb/GEZN01005583.1/.p1 GENE.gb/GEZN01005583.1/~~gb/GEZN01005583.1/.p1  ORF type:complete len:438 (-),score=156.81 gb/GEZN01005583.1/:431-1744(-)